MKSLFKHPAVKFASIGAAAAAVAVTAVAGVTTLPFGNGVSASNGNGARTSTVTTRTRSPLPTATATVTATATASPEGAGSDTTSATTPSAASPTQSAASPTGSAAQYVVLDNVRLALPTGWRATKLKDMVMEPAWCLHPAGDTVSSYGVGCPVMFAGAERAAQYLDVDIEGGTESNPQWCPVGSDWTSTGSTGVADFGGREAEHRRWVFTCPSGKVVRIEQYEVATSPGYLLYSERADAQNSKIMSELASTAELPAEQLPVRLYDRGIVRSIKKTGKMVKISIDRVYRNPNQPGKTYVNNSATTYAYQGPASLAKDLTVGTVIALHTDGHQVTELHRD